MQGELKCPLGGEFTLAEHARIWTSSKWQQESLALVDQVPEGYGFPFLQWLKEVDLSFNLTPTSLQTEVAIEAARTNDGGSPPLKLQPFSRQQPAAPLATAPWPPATPIIEPQTKPALQLSSRVIMNRVQALTNVTFSAHGERVLVGGFDRTASLFDVRTLREQLVLRGHEDVIWTVALSPNGSLAATGSQDRTLRFWNTRTGHELHRFAAAGIYSCVRISPDGNSVFATNWDGKVRIIEIPNFGIKSVIDCGQPA